MIDRVSRERTELGGQGLVLVRREALVAEEHDLMVRDRGRYELDLGGGKWSRQVEAFEHGTDRSGEQLEGERVWRRVGCTGCRHQEFDLGSGLEGPPTGIGVTRVTPRLPQGATTDGT